MIVSIDPGDVESAWVLYDEDEKKPVEFAKENNDEILKRFGYLKEKSNLLIIEMVASYGMPVGRSVFETCVWIGRFEQAWIERSGRVEYLYRKDVKVNLCHSMKAKDSNVRQAVMDRYGSDKKVAIGTKKAPGPLYGVKKDIWSALALAITWFEKIELEQQIENSKG